MDYVQLQVLQFYSGFQVIEIHLKLKEVFDAHIIVIYDPVGPVDVQKLNGPPFHDSGNLLCQNVNIEVLIEKNFLH